MTYKTFAAINVGSGEVSMKIYEISKSTVSGKSIMFVIILNLAVILTQRVISNMILSGSFVMFWNVFL